jgi:hypothetical protein
MKILKFTLLTALAAATAVATMAKSKRQAGAADREGSMSGYDDGMEDSLAPGADSSPGTSSRMSPGTSSGMSPGMSSSPGGGATSPATVTVTNAGRQPGGPATSPVTAGVGGSEGEPATADVTGTSSVDEPRPGLRSVGTSGDTGSRQP